MGRCWAPLLLAAAIALVGCGERQSDSEKEYVKKINQAQNDYLRRVRDIPTVSSNLEKASQSVAGMATEAAGLQKDIGGIEPPDEVKTEHSRLENTTKSYATALAGVSTDMKAGVKKGDRKQIETALRDLQTAAGKFGTDFGATIQAINRKIAC